MRKVIRAARQLRPALWYRGNFGDDGSSRRRDFWCNTNSYSLARNVDVCRCIHPWYMISRAISPGVAKVANGVAELNRDGPLMEYGRRIAAGELFDGDTSQLGTIGELQHLYDELVAKAGACRLDRYATSQKAGRRRWYLSRFMPQTPYTAVKGLYLHGGVGTGKTMLMDLFFDQLPINKVKCHRSFYYA
ncbi:AFG1-like ATPase family protein [Perilla frutescens var. hirtella]|uniref:AFG1-like ATPase family protein n=1 Tax=Perilla frutescens var. hirtella TaxID=608512 RepID=A0AAD4JLE0_PERFH|nr:AFG1-like ATPase family protein [Perilla frutescens var. hirtella]